jgi:hypothetical protein
LHRQLNRFAIRSKKWMVGIAPQGRGQACAIIGHPNLEAPMVRAARDLHCDKSTGLDIVVKNILAEL